MKLFQSLSIGCILTLGFFSPTIVLAQPPVVEDTPAISLFDRDTIGGNWGGLRSALQNVGIDVQLANFGDTIGVPNGGTRNRTTYGNLLQSEVEVDLDRFMGWKNGTFYFLGGGTWGVDPIDSSMSISNPSNLAAPDAFRVLEAWVEQSFLIKEKLALLLGIYSVDAEFDAKETADIFLNSGFGTGLDLSETGMNGPCIFPFTCLGVRLRVQPSDAFYFQTALTDGVAGDPTTPYGNKFMLDSSDGVFSISEIGVQFGPEGGNLRTAWGGWFYTTEFDDLLDVDGSGNPRRRDGTYGIYGFAEGNLFSEAEALSQGLSAYIRVGWADEDVNQIEYYVGGGLVYSGLIPTRDLDAAGFGVSVGFNGGKFKTAQRQAGAPVQDQEVALEWTYRAQIFPWLAIQPDVQYIFNPATDPTIDNVLVAGFRYESVF